MSRLFLTAALILVILTTVAASPTPRAGRSRQLLPTVAPARSSLRSAADDPHFYCNVSVASGSWTGTISLLYEQLTFVDALGSSITSFPVAPKRPFSFGTVLNPNDDFDVLFQITMIEVGAVSAESRRVCLFLISAYHAADPQVSAFTFNGAVNCTWTDAGVFQLFHVQ